MANEWNDEWDLWPHDGSIVDALGNRYGTLDRNGRVLFQDPVEGGPMVLDMSEIEGIQAREGRASIATASGRTFEYMGTPEGVQTPAESYEARQLMEPSGDNVYDMRRMTEALGIPERCHIDALSGIKRVDLRGLVKGGGVVRIGDMAIPYLREILNENMAMMSKRVRITEKGIIENLGFFAENREVNDFLDAIGKPSPDGLDIRYGYGLLEDCGGKVPGMDGDTMSRYLSKALEAYMLAVIQRQFEPVIVDMCLLIMGPQGVGKSNFARMLGGKFVIDEGVDRQSWFRSTEVGFKDHRKLMESVSGGVISEMAEGKQMEDVKGIKAFFDKDMEQYRRAYRPDEETLPIRSVFIITHNDDRPILDDTGGRRFLPVWMTGEGLRDPKDVGLEEWRGMWRRAWRDYETLRAEGWKAPWRKPFGEIKDLLPEIQNMAMASAMYDDEILASLKGIGPGEKFTLKELEDLLRAGLMGRVDYSQVDNAVTRFKKNPERFGFKKGTQNFGGDTRDKGYRKLRGHP